MAELTLPVAAILEHSSLFVQMNYILAFDSGAYIAKGNGKVDYLLVFSPQ